MERAIIDNCANCRFWAKDEPTRRDGRHVCRILTYPEQYGKLIAGLVGTGHVLTTPEFHCTLYKVAK